MYKGKKSPIFFTGERAGEDLSWGGVQAPAHLRQADRQALQASPSGQCLHDFKKLWSILRISGGRKTGFVLVDFHAKKKRILFPRGN